MLHAGVDFREISIAHRQPHRQRRQNRKAVLNAAFNSLQEHMKTSTSLTTAIYFTINSITGLSRLHVACRSRFSCKFQLLTANHTDNVDKIEKQFSMQHSILYKSI